MASWAQKHNHQWVFMPKMVMRLYCSGSIAPYSRLFAFGTDRRPNQLPGLDGLPYRKARRLLEWIVFLFVPNSFARPCPVGPISFRSVVPATSVFVSEFVAVLASSLLRIEVCRWLLDGTNAAGSTSHWPPSLRQLRRRACLRTCSGCSTTTERFYPRRTRASWSFPRLHKHSADDQQQHKGKWNPQRRQHPPP
jgi:hypothetical protein